jgi:hypothetical protein
MLLCSQDLKPFTFRRLTKNERGGRIEDRVTASKEYLSLKELCARIPYDDQTIRNLMTQGKLLKGIHYFKPHSRLIFKWTAIVEWIERSESG